MDEDQDEVEQEEQQQKVFGNPLVLEKIFKLLSVPDLKKCRQVSLKWEREATRVLMREKNVIFNLQKLHNPCCTICPVPVLHNPVLASIIKNHDRCPNGNHSDFDAFESSSQLFLAFCRRYYASIKEIHFYSPCGQSAPLREVLSKGAPPNLTSIVVVADDAIYSPVFEILYQMCPFLTSLRYVTVEKPRGFRGSPMTTLMESMVEASPNLEHLTIRDYMYPHFAGGPVNFALLTNLTLELSPYLDHNLVGTMKHDLFKVWEIRRIIREFSRTLENLTLISTDPVTYRNEYGNGFIYALVPDPNPDEPLLPVLPRLKVLKIKHSDCFILTPKELLVRNVPKLDTLEVSIGRNQNGDCVDLFLDKDFLSLSSQFKGHSGLLTLKLQGVDNVNVIELIGNKFSNLTSLHLRMTRNEDNFGVLLWSEGDLFTALARLTNLQHLQVRLSHYVQIPAFTRVLQDTQTFWESRNSTHQYNSNFLGLTTFKITIPKISDGVFLAQAFHRLKQFLLSVSKGMKRFEFCNFSGSYANATSLAIFISTNNLPVIFTDSEDGDEEF